MKEIGRTVSIAGVGACLCFANLVQSDNRSPDPPQTAAVLETAYRNVNAVSMRESFTGEEMIGPVPPFRC